MKATDAQYHSLKKNLKKLKSSVMSCNYALDNLVYPTFSTEDEEKDRFIANLQSIIQVATESLDQFSASLNELRPPEGD